MTDHGIHERKIFQGVKIFSRSKLSKDREHSNTEALPDRSKNIVYYQRTDVNPDSELAAHDYYELALWSVGQRDCF